MEFQLRGGLTFGVENHDEKEKKEVDINQDIYDIINEYAEEYKMNEEQKQGMINFAADILDTVDKEFNTKLCASWGEFLERKY
jgi:hypothetical protein